MGNTNKISHNKQDILGEGGFGQVFKGRFQGKYVAVKKILSKKEEEGMYAREEGFLKSYEHPNILKLFHSERDADFV